MTRLIIVDTKRRPREWGGRGTEPRPEREPLCPASVPGLEDFKGTAMGIPSETPRGPRGDPDLCRGVIENDGARYLEAAGEIARFASPPPWSPSSSTTPNEQPKSRVPGRRRHVGDAGSGSKVGVSVSRLRRPRPPCMSEAACRAPERPGLETVTLCVRLVRSFEHRNFRELVFHDVAVSQSVRDFMSLLLREIPTRAQLPPPFKKHTYDTLKIIHQAHGAKTNELVVSLEDDEHLLLHDEQTLHDSGVRHETVLAFFLLADYNKYKMNPTLTW